MRRWSFWERGAISKGLHDTNKLFKEHVFICSLKQNQNKINPTWFLSCTQQWQDIFLRAISSSRQRVQCRKTKYRFQSVTIFWSSMVCFSAVFRQGVGLSPGMQAAALGSTLGIALAGGALTGQYSNWNTCEFRGSSMENFNVSRTSCVSHKIEKYK